MTEFTMRVADNFTIMTLTLVPADGRLDESGNGIRLEQGFDGIRDAQGLRKLAADRRRCWRRKAGA